MSLVVDSSVWIDYFNGLLRQRGVTVRKTIDVYKG